MFFYISKVLGTLITPTNFLVLILAFATLLLFTRWIRFARSILVIAMLLLGGSTFLVTGQSLIAPLENRFPAAPELPRAPDGIILLGGAVDGPLSESRGQVSTFDGAERYFEFIRLMRLYPQARGLISGGLGSISQNGKGEAFHARRLLDELGADLSRITFEEDSRNTHENVVNSKRLVNPQAGSLWIVITSAYHMPRSVGIFQRQRWPVVAWPVDYRSHGPMGSNQWTLFGGEALNLVDTAIREWIGLVAYFMTDRTVALFPRAVQAGTRHMSLQASVAPERPSE